MKPETVSVLYVNQSVSWLLHLPAVHIDRMVRADPQALTVSLRAFGISLMVI